MEKIFYEITGRTESHVEWCQEVACKINHEIQEPLIQLKIAASNQGFDLKIVSGFRSFSRQEQIWNSKVRGERPVLDEFSNLVDLKNVEPEKLVFLILKWSASPGASRHHWGTEVDYFDGNISGHQLRLTTGEYLTNGVYNPLFRWLENNASKFDFFFPYKSYLGGVNPEPWHLSYFPKSKMYLENYSLEYFLENIRISTFDGKEILLNNAEYIFRRFIQNISPYT